jgi:hypothetical protein
MPQRERKYMRGKVLLVRGVDGQVKKGYIIVFVIRRFA